MHISESHIAARAPIYREGQDLTAAQASQPDLSITSSQYHNVEQP